MIPPWVAADLDGLDAAAGRRTLLPLEGPCGPRVRAAGRDVLNFSSNDYLALAADPRVTEAAARAARRWGAGAGASRLITGTLGVHAELEERLAALKGAESAVLFSTGYQANLGLLQALMPEGAILSDALNHASIVDACRLSRAARAVYRHGDAGHAAELLRAHRDAPRRLLVTDGVFSMDGDLAPLPDLLPLAAAHGALLAVDDAHATGVLGRGRGTAHHFGLDPRDLVQMGTLGKALGSFGAFVACPVPVRDLLVNRARSLIYTTAPPPAAAGAALEALRIVESEPERLVRLGVNAARLRAGLRSAGFPAPDAPTPIVPLVLGDNRTALRWAGALWERGFWAHPIRPPTVAEGTSRLRITVCSEHAPAEVDALCGALAELREESGSRGAAA